MKRTVAAVAAIGWAIAAPGAYAGPGQLTPIQSAYNYVRPATPSEVWTEPGGSFSFNKPVTWKSVDTASEVGAPVLEIVASGDDVECWFTRIPRAVTEALTPAALIRARIAPIGADAWARVGERQHLLANSAQVMETGVEGVGVWPVQTAWFSGPNRDAFAALHSRPGLDIWAICAAKNARRRAALLRGVALSVLTPKDVEWVRAVTAQAPPP